MGRSRGPPHRAALGTSRREDSFIGSDGTSMCIYAGGLPQCQVPRPSSIGTARYQSARHSTVWLGTVSIGMARHGLARHALALARFGFVTLWLRHGMIWHSTAVHSMARGILARNVCVKHGTANLDTARFAWHSTVRIHPAICSESMKIIFNL